MNELRGAASALLETLEARIRSIAPDGGKHNGLEDLKRYEQDFPYCVADWVQLPVLPDPCSKPSELFEEARRLIAEFMKTRIGKPVAIRSNSLREGGLYSFRGRHKSVIIGSADLSSVEAAIGV